jgi:hypothetical protein
VPCAAGLERQAGTGDLGLRGREGMLGRLEMSVVVEVSDREDARGFGSGRSLCLWTFLGR